MVGDGLLGTDQGYPRKPSCYAKLLKGTVICPYATNSTRPRIVALRNEILHKKAIGTTLSADVLFENHSEAASVLSGTMRNGNEVFRTVDNIPLGEFMEMDGFKPHVQVDGESVLAEGKVVEAVQTRYERNREAREACIAHYGARCAICGFDFKKTYGDAFDGIIQVHHIVPISEIGAEYIVDPIKDLIPVCPNCHAALHSKKDGAYLPDELKEMLKGKSSNR